MGDLQGFPDGATLLPSPAEPATATGEADRPAEHAESAMSAGRSTRMKTNTTKAAADKAAATTKPAATKPAAKKPVPVNADTSAWRFTSTTVSLMGHVFEASYSIAAKSGDIYVFAKMGETPVRIHVSQGHEIYHAAFEAAMAAKNPAAKAEPVAKQPEAKTDKPATPAKAAKQPEDKPAKAAKQPAKPATPAKAAKQPEAKPAKAAKQPAKPATPVQAAKQPEADGKSWIGTAIEGKGWRIVFDDATQRTRVTFTGDPSAKQKAAVEAAGFYWSAQLKSWNKKLTHKAYRASQTLAATLTALK